MSTVLLKWRLELKDIPVLITAGYARCSDSCSNGGIARVLANPISFDCPGMLMKNDKKHEPNTLKPMILKADA